MILRGFRRRVDAAEVGEAERRAHEFHAARADLACALGDFNLALEWMRDGQARL